MIFQGRKCCLWKHHNKFSLHVTTESWGWIKVQDDSKKSLLFKQLYRAELLFSLRSSTEGRSFFSVKFPYCAVGLCIYSLLSAIPHRWDCSSFYINVLFYPENCFLLLLLVYTMYKAPLRCRAALGSLYTWSHLIPTITLPGRYYIPHYWQVEQLTCVRTAGESVGEVADFSLNPNPREFPLGPP